MLLESLSIPFKILSDFNSTDSVIRCGFMLNTYEDSNRSPCMCIKIPNSKKLWFLSLSWWWDTTIYIRQDCHISWNRQWSMNSQIFYPKMSISDYRLYTHTDMIQCYTTIASSFTGRFAFIVLSYCSVRCVMTCFSPSFDIVQKRYPIRVSKPILCKSKIQRHLYHQGKKMCSWHFSVHILVQSILI